MRTRSIYTLWAVIVAVGFEPGLWGGSLRKIWEFNLEAALKISGGREAGRPGITALRFSSDGKKIAVASSPYRSGEKVMSHLLVVGVARPRDSIRQFEIDDLASDSDVLGTKPPAISWSPMGDVILAGTNLVHIQDGGICGIPRSFTNVLLDAGREAVLALRKSGRLEFFDSNCHLSGAWEMGAGEWSLADVSPDRAFVSGLRKTGTGPQPPEELVVIDPVGRRIVRSWPTSHTGYDSRFADYGKVLCAGDRGGDPFDPTEVPPRCMDVDTGETIAEASTIKGGAAFAAAEHASRVIASDQRSVRNWLYREYDTVLKRRVVWDFKKNAEIASWVPEIQSYSLLGVKPAKGPYMFAISADGQYMAEGGNGILRLYRIEP